MKICWSRIRDEKSEPWQAFTPFANLPAEVVFTTDEQTMLFGLKDNKVFEATFDLDVAHNSLLEAIKVLSEERRLLSGNLENETFEGEVGSSTLDKKTYLRLKPKMIEVNQLAQYGLNESERTENEAIQAMDLLTALFKARLGLMVKTEIKLNTIEASNS